MIKYQKFINVSQILVFTIFLNVIFESYIVKYNDYAYYFSNNPSMYTIILFIVFAIIPLCFFKYNLNILSFFVFIYLILIHIPIHVFLMHMFTGPFDDLVFIIIQLQISSFIFVLVSNVTSRNSVCESSKSLHPNLIFCIRFLSIAILVLMIINYFNLYTTVSVLEVLDIYTLRKNSKSYNSIPLIGYIVMWATYVFFPIVYYLFLVKKNKIDFFISLFLIVSIFLVSGAKILILLILFIFFIHKLKNINYIYLYLSLLVCISVVILFLLPDEGVYLYAKSILFIRSYGISGWTFITYYEYFSKNGFTYLSHIGFLNHIFDYYPYGNLEIGQLIGKYYHGSSDSNPNANYLVSDGVSSFGIYGILLINIVVLVKFYIIYQLTKIYHFKLVLSFFISYIFIIINAPLFISIFSGGLFLILGFLISNRFLYIK